MAFDIEEFKSQHNNHNGYLRTNKFKVLITSPQILLGSAGTEAARSLEFYCQDAVLPGYQLMTGNVRRWGYGPNESRPFSPNFQQVQLLFNVDGRMSNHEFFHNWLDAIIPHNTDSHTFNTRSNISGGENYALSYKTEYATDIHIMVYNESGEQLKTVVLKEAFPSNINQTELSWGDQNQLAQFTVFIEYLDWYSE